MEMWNNFLYKDYQEYIKDVTTPEMAISLECSSFLLKLCDDISPRSVVDLGSGFSSFALRKYRKEYNKFFTIISVDTNSFWLDKTRKFVEDRGIECSNLILFNDFIIKQKYYDLILYDIAYYQNGSRQQLLIPILQRIISDKTNILFDDMHVNHYFMFVLQTMFGLRFNMINTKPYTIDNFGRFSMLFNSIGNI